MQRRVVSEYTDVSEVRIASIIREIIVLMMETVRTSETSVYSETTWRYIPEDSKLDTAVRPEISQIMK
jgi:hypothetical protein